MSTPAVELHGLAQRLGGRWALRGVDLAVGAGEVVAVIGHNGSGKTTLLRVIATLLRPTRGEGRVLGHDLRRDANAVRAAVTLLPHDGGQYSDLSAFENLQFAQRMLGDPVDRTAIASAIDWCGLGGISHLRVRSFSSGMRRRLALAAIRMRMHMHMHMHMRVHTHMRAPVLLMDEPFNSLDVDGGRLIDELLHDTKARGGAAIVVLHDVARSASTFDRTVELRDGLVVGDTVVARPSLSLAR